MIRRVTYSSDELMKRLYGKTFRYFISALKTGVAYIETFVTEAAGFTSVHELPRLVHFIVVPHKRACLPYFGAVPPSTRPTVTRGDSFLTDSSTLQLAEQTGSLLRDPRSRDVSPSCAAHPGTSAETHVQRSK